jgi:hypothetical protein
MHKAIRKEDGTCISQGEWKAILYRAHEVKRDLLDLPHPNNRAATATRGRKYFRTHFPKEWYAALDKMERLEPLLALCSAYWKAEHVLGGVLLRTRQPAGDRGGEVEETDDAGPSSSGSRKRRETSAPPVAKRRKTETEAWYVRYHYRVVLLLPFSYRHAAYGITLYRVVHNSRAQIYVLMKLELNSSQFQ